MSAPKILKSGGGATVAPKILKSDSFTAMIDAVSIVDQAREQARALLEEAQRSRDQVIQEARLQGEAEGVRRYIEETAALSAKLDQYFVQAEPQLIRLAAGIARKVLGEELRLSPDAVVGIARESLAGARRARQVKLRVHPSDAPRIQDNAQLKLSPATELDICADPAIEPGGCVIETDLGVIDARLETQLRVIERALSRNRS